MPINIVALPLWMAGSMLLLSIQWIFTAWNVAAIFVEMGAIAVSSWTRYALRWVTYPWSPGRWREKNRMWNLLRQMHAATTYQEWLFGARELDVLEGGEEWRKDTAAGQWRGGGVVDRVSGRFAAPRLTRVSFPWPLHDTQVATSTIAS